MENIPENEIIARIIAGETRLFEDIIRRYNSCLYKTGRSYGFSHADTEDLMQETYLSVFSHLNQFRYQSSFKTWMIRIMLNHCYHKTRKQSYLRELRGLSVRETASILDISEGNVKIKLNRVKKITRGHLASFANHQLIAQRTLSFVHGI